MTSVRLAHWHEVEGRERAKSLEGLGFSVLFDPVDAGTLLKIMKADPPDGVVVDLTRGPAQGRDLAVALRIHGATRDVPLVFAGGAPEKVAGVRRLLSDATFSDWDGIAGALAEALEHPPTDPVVPDSALAGYSGTPLPKKLGIKAGTRVLLSNAPPAFSQTLGPLPEGAELLRRFGSGVDLILWFVRSTRELDEGIEKWAGRVGRGGIWIIWPKKGSTVFSDLTQAIVRRAGLDAGLVDYKIAAIDDTWSGLKFAVRKGK